MTARLLDLAERAGDEDEREGAHAAASLLTPVAKAFATDMGVEVASEGVQVHGGMGYVEETGAAQHLRDARIAPIYEGTNGIQAIDLVTRKLPLEEGAVVRRHIAELQKTVNDVRASNLPAFGQTPQRLEEAVDALSEATEWMLGALGSNRQAALAGAAPYTRLFGIASGAVWLAKGAVGAARRDDDAGSVLALARYYAENHAVEAPGLARTVTEGGESVLEAASPVLGG
jgi:butyryl-CoA dehydrogenase